jgi:DNA polymerase-4
VRFGDYSTINRSSRRPAPVAHTADIWDTARGLLSRADIGRRSVRLLGIAVSDLVDAAGARQLELGAERRDAAAEAVDEVRERFGSASVIPARIVPRRVAPPDHMPHDP